MPKDKKSVKHGAYGKGGASKKYKDMLEEAAEDVNDTSKKKKRTYKFGK